MQALQTQRDNITNTKLISTDKGADDFELADGEVLLRVERFAFTANNITYGTVGEQVGYWQFFPPPIPDTEHDWGMIPVWGFAQVVRSTIDEIKAGERLYGYFPMATFLTITPIKIAPDRLVDGAAHRAELPPVYNQYNRLGSAPTDIGGENLQALLMPLYVTSFCLADCLATENKDAAQVIIVSASSKTSIGLAYGLSLREAENRPHIVGLTSPANVDFVNQLGLYDQTISYDELAMIDTSMPTAMVDMSGNRAVLGEAHQRLGDHMLWCHNVGLTHWDDSETAQDPLAAHLNRERSAMFFAPAYIQKCVAAWGHDEYDKRIKAFMQGGVTHARDWLNIAEIDGLAAFTKIYDEVVAGKISPQQGLIISI